MSAPAERETPRASDRRQAWLIGLSLFALYVIWGSTYFAIRVAIDVYPPLQVAGFRFCIAGGLLYLLLRWRGAPAPTMRQWVMSTFIGLLLVVGGNATISVAEKWVASSLAAVMVATMPLWAALFSGLFGAWPTRSEWMGLLLGAVGVLLLNSEAELRASPLGAGLLLLSPALWALGSVLSGRLSLPKGLMAPAAQMMSAGVVLIPLSLAFGETWVLDVHPRELGAIVYLITFGSMIGYSAYAYLLRTVRPALATSYAYVNPLVALLLGVGLRGERITLAGYVGTAVILGAVAMIALFRTAQGRRALATAAREES